METKWKQGRGRYPSLLFYLRGSKSLREIFQVFPSLSWKPNPKESVAKVSLDKRLVRKHVCAVTSPFLRKTVKHQTIALGDVTVIELCGDVTDQTGFDLMRETVRNLAAQGRIKVVLNLEKVGLMNSLGLGMLISSLATLTDKDGDLKLANITERIRRLIVISRLVTTFHCYDSVNEAVRSFKQN